MAAYLVNAAPAPEDTGVLVEDLYRISLREGVTRVDPGTLLAQLVYSKNHYDGGPDLPEDTASLVGDTFTAAFSDAGATSVPSSDVVDRTPGTPLVMTRDQAGAHRGAQFIRSVPISSPYVFEVEVTPTAWTLGAAAYLNDARYAGVCFGLVYGPDKTGVFGFLIDDAGNKKVLLSGPDDGTGTRPGSVEYALDWSLGYVFKFVWDPDRDLVDVYVRLTSDPDAYATKLHSFTLSVLAADKFAADVAFGSTPIGPTSSDVTMLMGFLNLDSPTIADSLTSEFIRVFEYGRNLIIGGVTQAGVVQYLTPTDLLAADLTNSPKTAFMPWEESTPTGSIVASSVGTKIDKPLATADGAQRTLLRRDEPGFTMSDGVMLYAQFAADAEQHAGTVGTGMGFAFDDGTDRLLLMLLDNFADNLLGVYQVGDNAQALAYQASLEFDWEVSVGVKMFVNGVAGTVHVFALGNDDTPLLSATLADLAPSLGDPVVEVGHVDVYTAKPVFGSITLTEMRYGLDVIAYDAIQAVVPADPGALPTWTEVAPGAGSSAMSGGLFVLVDGAYGTGVLQGRRLQHRIIPNFGATVGVSAEGRFLISSWSNQAGNQDPLEPISCGLGIDDGTEVVQTCFVEGLSAKFVYIPGFDEAQSLSDVLAQNLAGQAISAAVDFSVMHTYRLEKKPGLYIRLFIDDSFTPAITVPWNVATGFDIPPTLGVGVGALFGSMDVSRKSASSWRRAVFSSGKGYDLAVRPALTVEERTNVFDTASEIILHVEGI